MGKPFLSFDEQIDKLQNEKGLVITDRDYAKQRLQEIGYFGLIGGYKVPFKDQTTKKYMCGTTFDDICALYEFDEDLREFFLKYILRIERHLRSLISYYFSEKYGAEQDSYLAAENFTKDHAKEQEVSRLTGALRKLAIDSAGYPYIVHHRDEYGNVPLWVLVGALSFGNLSKFYRLSTSDIQARIAKEFRGVNERQLSQYLKVLTSFRNVCAHNERLFSHKTTDDIPDTVLHEKLHVPQKGAQYVCGKRDLFALVISFRYLLPVEDFFVFKRHLSFLIAKYLSFSNVISEPVLYDMMGFPANWKKISSYKK